MKIKDQEVHASVTVDRVVEQATLELTTLENPGICIACGADADGCEPDAENYKCEECGERQVYGASQLAIYMA